MNPLVVKSAAKHKMKSTLQRSENGFRKLRTNRVVQMYGNSVLITAPFGITFIIGRHWIGVLVTICVILGGTTMNLRILERTGSLSDNIKIYYKVFISVCFVLTNVFLFLTATSDPGIVFCNDDDEQESFNLDQIPFCDICGVYQPQRKKIYHCGDCNYCIEGMDHHCPWMGQCIGRKNMKWFLLFNVTWVVFFAEFLYLAFSSGAK